MFIEIRNIATVCIGIAIVHEFKKSVFLKTLQFKSIQIKALEECEWLNILLAYLRELELAD